MKIAKTFIVTGRVQGVFFRKSTQSQAQEWGLTGWVMNLPDGQVEGVVCGEPEHVDKMLSWLKVGPEMALVSDLEIHDCVVEDWNDFSIV